MVITDVANFSEEGHSENLTDSLQQLHNTVGTPMLKNIPEAELIPLRES